MSWEIATSVGLIGIAGLLIYFSSILDNKHWVMKHFFQIFAFWIMLAEINFIQDIAGINSQAGLSGIFQALYFNFQWVIVFYIVYVIAWFFYDTVNMVKEMMAQKKKKREEGE